MIIVSQDKNKIINLDNVINIEYADYTNISRGHEIYCNGVVKNAIKLGVYKTKERAKEVLQEIIKCYDGTNYEYENCWCLRNVTYFMPEE